MKRALAEPAEFEEKRNERSGDEVAGGRRREHRNRDELVCGAARVAGHYPPDTGQQRRDTDHRGRDAADHLAHLPLIGFEPLEDRAEREESQPDESSAQANTDSPAFLGRQSAGQRRGAIVHEAFRMMVICSSAPIHRPPAASIRIQPVER